MTKLIINNSVKTTAVFLSKILSDEGLIVLAEFRNGAMKKHHFLPTYDEASKRIHALNESGAEVYHGCATYKTNENRKQANVATVKSFFVDIDIGKADGYQTRSEAVEALKTLCTTVGFHVPYIVSSGKGLHCYWLFDAAVSGEVWKAGAQTFRQVLDSLNFKHDPSRTTDQSSILRPVGSTWRKAGEKPVKMIYDSNPQPFGWYLARLNKYIGVSNIPLAAPSKKYFDILPVEKLGSKAEYPPSSAIEVANKCGQLARMRDFKGAVSEPEWRNAIGVIKHTVEGNELCHAWSAGDPRYDYDQTQEKIDRWETGPTTCEVFERTFSQICASCKFKGKVKSPIQLGFASTNESIIRIEDVTKLPRLESSEGRINFSIYPPPPRIYVLQDLILTEKVCVLAGLGGVSKTMLSMLWAVCIVLGLPWNGKFGLPPN